jgi:hypothetical protein
MRRYRIREDGVSILEYVLLVALVAMVATGTLLYLGRGSGSPSHVANNVGDNVAAGTNPDSGNVGNGVAVGSIPISGNGGNNVPAGTSSDSEVAGSSINGKSMGAPVKAWCTSGETGCSDPMLMNGQPEIIHFWATGGSGNYSYQLQGSVPPFMIPDWPEHEITVEPTDCSQDPGTYIVSLVVSDSAGDTGTLSFTLNVAPGSLCQT